MKLIMTHGYMLSDTGSNVYVQNLCCALVREGHEVYLLCQEPEPLSYDFVDQFVVVDGDYIGKQGQQDTPYPGRCVIYRPQIGGLLPVYVYDHYPGWRATVSSRTTLGRTLPRFGRHSKRPAPSRSSRTTKCRAP